jgi:hypothetical protein
MIISTQFAKYIKPMLTDKLQSLISEMKALQDRENEVLEEIEAILYAESRCRPKNKKSPGQKRHLPQHRELRRASLPGPTTRVSVERPASNFFQRPTVVNNKIERTHLVIPTLSGI